jgi:pSer/pThr/pTyr-binding forkhead associated (FHA) protein
MVMDVLPAVRLPIALLTVRSGPDLGFRFRIKPVQKAYLGRDAENDVVLEDQACSRRHARVEFRDGRYMITDLGSVNGTYVNDVRVVDHPLTNGDRIRLGQDELILKII